MSVVYQRSGGFAGMNDVLRLGDEGLELTRRGKSVAKRALTSEESGRLKQLVATAKTAPVPAPPAPGRRIPDAFNYSLTLDGEPTPRIQLNTPSRPSPSGEPWMDLLGWLEELMAAEIERAG